MIDRMDNKTTSLPAHTLRAKRYLEECIELLCEKGAMYGSSVSEPFFPQKVTGANAKQGILVRIGDKLKRLIYLLEIGRTDTEDSVRDIINYFALYATCPDPEKKEAPQSLREAVEKYQRYQHEAQTKQFTLPPNLDRDTDGKHL